MYTIFVSEFIVFFVQKASAVTNNIYRDYIEQNGRQIVWRDHQKKKKKSKEMFEHTSLLIHHMDRFINIMNLNQH